MKLRVAAVLLALLPLAACQRDAATPTTTGAAPAAAQPAASVAAASAEDPAQAQAARAAAEAAMAAAANAPPLVAGTDYEVIANGQPFDPLQGQVEIVEVFGYTCPHCAAAQPLMHAFKAGLPQDVRFTYLAAPFSGYWEPYAKAFYAAESLGAVDKTHDAVFRAIHIDRSLPVQPGPTPDQLAAFYANYGVDPGQFKSAMSSFAVNGKMNRAQQFLARSGVESTPQLIVNGKYRVLGRSLEDTVRIAQQLVAQERAAGGAAAEPAPAPAAQAPQGG